MIKIQILFFFMSVDNNHFFISKKAFYVVKKQLFKILRCNTKIKKNVLIFNHETNIYIKLRA